MLARAHLQSHDSKYRLVFWAETIEKMESVQYRCIYALATMLICEEIFTNARMNESLTSFRMCPLTYCHVDYSNFRDNDDDDNDDDDNNDDDCA